MGEAPRSMSSSRFERIDMGTEHSPEEAELID
jgi:hypothetical protein